MSDTTMKRLQVGQRFWLTSTKDNDQILHEGTVLMVNACRALVQINSRQECISVSPYADPNPTEIEMRQSERRKTALAMKQRRKEEARHEERDREKPDRVLFPTRASRGGGRPRKSQTRPAASLAS